MKRIVLSLVAVCIALSVSAQYYGSGNSKIGSKRSNKSNYRNNLTTTNTSAETKDPWNCSVVGIGYIADTEFLDKGSFGLTESFFAGSDRHVGAMLQWSDMYNLASEKFMDNIKCLLGPIFYQSFTDNFILFAPLCVSISTLPGGKKLYWGAALMPSIGLKAGALFLSAGWNITYPFSGEKKEIDTKTVSISLGVTI